MTTYADRTDAQRRAIMDACTQAGSQFHERTADGFRVAIGRRRYGDTVWAMAAHGFTCARLFTFPLGTDTPPDHLRHDADQFPACRWLFADFIESPPVWNADRAQYVHAHTIE